MTKPPTIETKVTTFNINGKVAKLKAPGDTCYDKHVFEINTGKGTEKGVWFECNPICIWFRGNLY